MGRLFSLFNFRYKVIEKNVKQVFPELRSDEIAQFIKKIYRHFGLLIVEIMLQAHYKRLKTGKRIAIDGLEENLGSLVKNGQGVCVLTGHIGNWELAGAALAEHGYDNQIVVKEMKSEAGTHLLYCIRDKNGVKTLPRRNAVRDILRCLREGKVVTFVLDQNMTSDEGIFVDFFGKKACTMPSLATIVRKTGAPVVPGAVFRNDDLRSHTLWVGPQIEWESREDAKEEIAVNTRKYNVIIEQMIMKHPEQWIWMHKRWKTRPES